MDIHNEYLLGWLKANEKDANVKKFKEELDKGVKKLGYNSYILYLEDNIGDDASFTVKELEDIKKGKLVMKYNEKDGKLHFFEYT
jgi:hypothetical protein